MNHLAYSMYIRWSDDDQCYIAWLPEFGDYVSTHGETYEEAAKNGREVIEMVAGLIDAGEWNGPIPTPYKYGDGKVITPPGHEGKPLPPGLEEQYPRHTCKPSKEAAGV